VCGRRDIATVVRKSRAEELSPSARDGIQG
jgi:hypothetical protein